MKKIPLFKSYMSWRAVRNACILLIKSNYGTYLGEGPQVKAFEEEFGAKFSLKNVIALNSGTSALELAYELAGVGEGDEVITPIFTAVMTNLPLIHRRAKIVFADIESDLNISVDDVLRKITPKTKAVVFVHMGGKNRGLGELLQVAKERNIVVIEDAAQAIGSDYWGKADFVCTSLQSIKTLTSVDGGFLMCRDTTLYEKAKRLRWFGYNRDEKQKNGDTDIVEAGYKYHMSDLTACIGRGNLSAIDSIIAHRKVLCLEYKRHGIDASIWFAMIYTREREKLIQLLRAEGIAAGTHHFRNDKYTVFGGRQKFTNMDRLEDQYLFLPLHHGMTVKDVGRICDILRNANNTL